MFRVSRFSPIEPSLSQGFFQFTSNAEVRKHTTSCQLFEGQFMIQFSETSNSHKQFNFM